MKQLLTLCLLFLIFTGCNGKKDDDIKIGFVAGLSGKYSSLGIDIRDGFMLAFDEIDYKIDNKKVKIIQKDDKQDPNEAKKIIDSFIKDNIKLVVGNATSSMTAISLKTANKHNDMLLCSATASSNNFSGKDDNFIRVQSSYNTQQYKIMKKYFNKKGYKNIVFIYDSKNKKYTQGYVNILEKLMIQDDSGKFISKIDINTPYKNILDQVRNNKKDLFLIVANSIDSANFIQYLKINHIQTPIVASGWAMSNDFITNGGNAVDGVRFFTSFDINSKLEKYQKFIKSYQNIYNRKPSQNTMQGYELAKILIENLKQSDNISTLKQKILSHRIYDGLQGNIIFDKFGDVHREYFIVEVQNGNFIKIEE